MLELLQRQGVITKGQNNYLQTKLTRMMWRLAAKKREERKLQEIAIQEKIKNDEKALQEKKKQDSTCPVCGKQALIERWHPRQECEPLMGGCGYTKDPNNCINGKVS